MSTNWSKIGFGKYYDKTFPEVLLNDPAWFFHPLRWGGIPAVDTEAFASLGAKWHEVIYKGHHIKIPKADPENWRVLWDPYDSEHPFSVIRLNHVSPLIRPYLDLDWPFEFGVCYEEDLSKAVSSAFRENFFGGSELTCERCNQFISNDDNFVFPFGGKPDLPEHLVWDAAAVLMRATDDD